ncbi:hypothetical protein H257_19262, partial [Aphanomyces astaci]
SFAPIPKFDDRFARQNRYELPPEFPLASPYSGIVHHLSGTNIYAHTQIFHQRRLLGPCFKTGRIAPFRQSPEQQQVKARINPHTSTHDADHTIRTRRTRRHKPTQKHVVGTS